MKQVLLKTWLILACLLMLGGGKVWAESFSTTYSYGLSGWSLTNYTDQSSYYQVPTGTGVTTSVAAISGIFSGKTITSDVVVTINCATYGSGTDPNSSTFSLYKENACTNAITATQGGTLPTSSTYTNVTYTVTQANAASLGNDLAIKITKPGKTIRLKSIKVAFTYTSGGGSNPTALSVPTSLSSSNVTTTGATLSWDEVSNKSSYTVKIGETEHTGITTNSYSATGLTAGTQYTWTVKAVGDGTNYTTSEYAANANFTTKTEQGGGGEPSGDGTWTLCSISDLTGSDIFVIVDTDSKKAMTNNNGTSNAPTAAAVTISQDGNTITGVTDVMKWNISGNSTNGYTFYPNGSTTTWLYCTATNNGVRVGTNASKTFTLSGNHLLHAGTSRYVGVYDGQDWRCYTSNIGNIAGTITKFYKYEEESGDPEKTITALAVSGTPTKTTYTAGENFDPAGLVVTATYSDDTQEEISTGFDWKIEYGTDNTALVVGATSVNVLVYTEDQEVMSEVYTVNGLTVTVPVTLTSIAVSGIPNKTEYYDGDAFETAGLVVTGTYSDSHQETITEGIEWIIDPETLTFGTTSVDVMASVGAVVSEVYTVNGLIVTKASYKDVTYNFSSFTSSQTVELTDLDGFTITLKSNGGTTPAWNDGASEARVYAKGSLTVKANNATIKSIEYSYVVNANSKNVIPTIDGVEGKTDTGTWDVENKTWTGADEEVTFSTSGSAGNIGFTKLIIKYIEGNKTIPTLSFSAPTAEVTIGVDNNEFPTLITTPADLEGVIYESSNTDVATIDENTGVVALVAAGETTITAKFAGNDDYTAATPASYTLIVVKAPFVPSPAPEGFEVVKFSTIYSSDANVEDYVGKSFALTFEKPQSSRTPTKYYENGNAVRAYVNNSITINGAEDIKYVDIAWVSGYVDDGVTITGLGTTTAVVTFSKTCRFTKITVSYKGSNSTLVATDGENYYATFSSEKNVVFANATAYTVSVADDKLSLTEVACNKVPAGNAVLIKSATANVDYYYVDDDNNFENNMLQPCTETGIFKAEADDNYYYKLAYGDNTNKTKLGFWWGTEDGSGNFKVKAGGAVLVVPQSAGVRGFSFTPDGVLTGVSSVSSNDNQDSIYSLQGQRMLKLQRGVNIVNGRKIIR